VSFKETLEASDIESTSELFYRKAIRQFTAESIGNRIDTLTRKLNLRVNGVPLMNPSGNGHSRPFTWCGTPCRRGRSIVCGKFKAVGKKRGGERRRE
jgi:hypothetical protein